MSENIDINLNMDKLTIQQLRKERKILKKTIKRKEREKEYEKKKLEIKLGPKDQHVTIISSAAADNINKIGKTHTNNSDFNLSNENNNFPTLDNAFKLKQKHVKAEQKINSETNVHKQMKSNTILINLSEILSNSKPSISKKKSTEKIEKYAGNILDSSKPMRHKGKHREISKSKPLTKLKSQIISDMKNESTTVNICYNEASSEVNELMKEFLSNVVRYQENLYKKDSIKGVAKRRYIVGFREVKKYLVIKKIKVLIIAPDIKNVVENGALDNAVQELISLAKEISIPYIFALSRRKLGKITLKFVPVSCVGILNYDGTEQLLKHILEIINMSNYTKNNEGNNK